MKIGILISALYKFYYYYYLLLPDPARRPPLFQSSTLTESLEQAKED